MKSLGQIAYEAFLNVAGSPLSQPWNKMGAVAKQGWEAAAAAVIANQPPKPDAEEWKGYFNSAISGSLAHYAGFNYPPADIVANAIKIADEALVQRTKRFGG